MSHLLACGDARRIPLADQSVQCCITSPPFYGLRDYGIPGQLGLEATPDVYLAGMVGVFRDVWRVLRDDGVLFLNMGDSYARQGGEQGGGLRALMHLEGKQRRMTSIPNGADLKPKDLIGMPWRLALALQADGWTLRCDIIWAKPNPMPESVTDRPTKSHEYVFMLTKRQRYYWDALSIAESCRTKDIRRPYTSQGAWQIDGRPLEQRYGGKPRQNNQAGYTRNLRSVLTIPTQAYPGAHFATYPEALIRPFVLAGTSERGACPECGKAWERVTERYDTGERVKMPDGWDTGAGGHGSIHRNGRQAGELGQAVIGSRCVGWRPACPHTDLSPVPCVVFDPFVGSGTTVAVACGLGRRGIGLDLSADYLSLARHRLERPHARTPRPSPTRGESLPLFDRGPDALGGGLE